MITLIQWVILGISALIFIVIMVILFSYFDHKKRAKKILHFQLKSWIKRAKEMGHSDQNVEGMLITRGWDANAVRAAMHEGKEGFYK